MDERLYEAAIRGNVEKLQLLLTEDANRQAAAEPLLDRVMRECSGKDNPLHLGALFGRVEFVREISSRKPEFARQLNSQGQSPLHLAAERGHLEVVKVLLEIDADVCFVRDPNGRIPLHLAVIKGRIEVVEELVNAKKITAWFLTNEKEPILHLCSNHDQFDTLKKLVSLVNDDEFVTLRDSNDNTILHLLCATAEAEMIMFLLHNTNIETKINDLNVDKVTALDELCKAKWGPDFIAIRKLFRGKGAKRSRDVSVGQPTKFPSRASTKQARIWLERMGPPLLVLAVLLATVTFQAILTPPGGFWQDDYPGPGSDHINATENGTNDILHQHSAGYPILAGESLINFELFSVFSTIGFLASLGTILIIAFGHQLHPTYASEFLMWSMSIAITSFMSAFFCALTFSYPPQILVIGFLMYLVIYVGPFIFSYGRGYSNLRQRTTEGEVKQQQVVIQMTTDHQDSHFNNPAQARPVHAHNSPSQRESSNPHELDSVAALNPIHEGGVQVHE